ncbi:TadA family conjugal transfer-associated ATPase [Nocardioides sp.]|uniref:TadA family conjugal transfer-associated ATPase n=1 Tax=Nocardioides sp. TaxID=35761 RepID=UPI003561F5D9
MSLREDRDVTRGELADLEVVRERLAREPGELTPHRVAQALRGSGRPVGDETVLRVHEALRRDVLGAGPLDPLLRVEGVTDVLVNGPERVYLDRGQGLELTSVRFPDEEAVRRLAQRLAASGGRRLDDASPQVDLRLVDGTRFHCVLAPIARPGTLISLRVPRARGFSVEELLAAGALTRESARLVRAIVGARLAFLVSGGTGSGKTTLLAALLGTVDPGERLVLVEDSSELRPAHPHVVALESRPPNIEGAGEVDLRTLVRQALRMRPDRLVVGEVRGAEVVDLLAALNTGHQGGCGTLHANSAADVSARVEALALAGGLGRDAVHSQLGAALDVVLHLDRASDGRRQLREVAMPERSPDGLVSMVTAWRLAPDGAASEFGPAAARLADRLGGGGGFAEPGVSR